MMIIAMTSDLGAGIIKGTRGDVAGAGVEAVVEIGGMDMTQDLLTIGLGEMF